MRTAILIIFLITFHLSSYCQFSEQEETNNTPFTTNSPFPSFSSNENERGFIGQSNNSALSGPGTPSINPPDPDNIPIDGGIWFLLAAGIVYSIYKLKKQKVSTSI